MIEDSVLSMPKNRNPVAPTGSQTLYLLSALTKLIHSINPRSLVTNFTIPRLCPEPTNNDLVVQRLIKSSHSKTEQ